MMFDDECKELRQQIKGIAGNVFHLKNRGYQGERREREPDVGEMMANLMLTYRHLEDAVMRLGKAIQAFDGGVSVYDK